MDRTSIYGLEFQTRAMCAQNCESEKINFFVGTQSLKDINQVHLVNYDDDKVTAKIYTHPFGEIWDLNSSCHDKRVLSSCYSSSGSSKNHITMRAALLTIPEEELVDEVMSFEEQDLNVSARAILQTAFHPTDSDSVAVITDTSVQVVKVKEGGSRQVCEVQGNGRFKRGKWALHNQNSQLLVLSENSVLAYDVRDTNKVAWTITNEHVFRDLDCNPSKQFRIVTGGDDGCIKIWDYRNCKEPIFSRDDHSHWVWTVRFNPFHDQILLSSSSDARVNITCAFSVSSEADTVSPENSQTHDGLLESLDYHDDSVYCAEWSTADPWTFASLSYDGRFILNKIPKEIKYKILLERNQ